MFLGFADPMSCIRRKNMLAIMVAKFKTNCHTFRDLFASVQMLLLWVMLRLLMLFVFSADYIYIILKFTARHSVVWYIKRHKTCIKLSNVVQLVIVKFVL